MTILIQIVCCLLGPAAIIVAAGVAWLNHRRIAVQSFTVQFIADKEIGNPDWLTGRALFAKYGENLNGFFADSEIDHESKMHMLMFLNHNEFVALAIKNRAMDERLYKEWRGTAIVNVWNSVSTYVHSRRTKIGQAKMYTELEWLAKKWGDSSQ